MSPRRAIAYVRAHRKESLTELKDFIRFPTVSAQPKHEGDIRRCASWLAGHLRRIGLDDVRIVPTQRHPLVYASWQGARGRPTLLIYGHYDVQPATRSMSGIPSPSNPPFEAPISLGAAPAMTRDRCSLTSRQWKRISTRWARCR